METDERSFVLSGGAVGSSIVFSVDSVEERINPFILSMFTDPNCFRKPYSLHQLHLILISFEQSITRCAPDILPIHGYHVRRIMTVHHSVTEKADMFSAWETRRCDKSRPLFEVIMSGSHLFGHYLNSGRDTSHTVATGLHVHVFACAYA